MGIRDAGHPPGARQCRARFRRSTASEMGKARKISRGGLGQKKNFKWLPVNAMPTPERWGQRCFLLQADGETRSPFEIAVRLDLPSLDGKADPKIVPPRIDTAAMESLKALDSDRPIREADIKNLAPSVRYRSDITVYGKLVAARPSLSKRFGS